LPTKRLKIIAHFKNATVQFCQQGELLFSHKNKIFSISDLSKPRPRLIGNIPWKGCEIISHIRFFDRYFKYGILQVHKNKEGEYLILTGKNWWKIESRGKTTQIEIPSATLPMHRGICESRNHVTYVSEYLSNPDRKSVKIFRTTDLTTFEVAWEFPENSIRHIHAIIPDTEIEDRIWVLTGDADGESAFYYTDNEFKDLTCFFRRGQQSRAVDMIIRQGRLYWGMDSPNQISFMMSMDRKNPNDIDKLYELPGPVYYLSQNEAGGLYAGTTAEPGASVKDKKGHIIALKPDNSWEDILQLKTDIFPQFGIFYFPKGIVPENYIVFSARALQPLEGHLLIARDLAWN
jgi:hypothetical protein